ncbi:MAG: helix-turn-helix transcriptional regulator [Calditrichaeota bacterium]|nr:helix-turn-helix transcriptional regulator [Calditrichota bacterium]MCB9369710.1 helix-turn-helix transcriptional regulator [Calditrichota bacterium]
MNALRLITELDVAAGLLNLERQELLELLAEPNSASSLARITKRPRQQINYHLRELEKRGLIKHVEDRKRGNCVERVLVRADESLCISPSVLGALAPVPEREPDKLSANYLIATAAKLIRELGHIAMHAGKKRKKVATFTLSAEVRFASPEKRAEFAREASDALARISAKYNDDQSPEGRTFNWIFGAYPAITKDLEGE